MCGSVENDSPRLGHFVGRHRNPDFLFGAVFRAGDSALLTEAASIAPAGSESRPAHEIHPGIPGKSASRSEHSAAGRRTRKCGPGRVVPRVLVGRSAGRAHPPVAGRDCDLCRCGAAVRFDSENPGAFGAL